jgi:hypothetical protein
VEGGWLVGVRQKVEASVTGLGHLLIVEEGQYEYLGTYILGMFLLLKFYFKLTFSYHYMNK